MPEGASASIILPPMGAALETLQLRRSGSAEPPPVAESALSSVSVFAPPMSVPLEFTFRLEPEYVRWQLLKSLAVRPLL